MRRDTPGRTARKVALNILALGSKPGMEGVLAEVVSWDSTAMSVIVAEGLIQYLDPAAVRDLFVQCRRVVGPGSRIAFTYMGRGDDDRPDAGRWTGLLMWLLEVSGEPWLWSIRPAELPELLEETGWHEQPDLAGGASMHGLEYFSVAVACAL